MQRSKTEDVELLKKAIVQNKSFNECKRSLITLVQISQKGTLKTDFVTIVKRDRWERTFNDGKWDRLKQTANDRQWGLLETIGQRP